MTTSNLLLCTGILIVTGTGSLYAHRNSTLKWFMPAVFVFWLVVGIFTARSTYEGEEAIQRLETLQQAEIPLPEGAVSFGIIEWNIVRGFLFGGIGCFLSAVFIYFLNRNMKNSTSSAHFVQRRR